CCVGTGFENHAKYGEAIYYHDHDALYINLFIASELSWKDKGVKIRQETAFPQEETSVFTISTESPTDLSLHIRYPSWATSGATVKVNGKKINIKQRPGSYIAINQRWNDGDKIEVNFPMALKIVPTPDDPNKVAFTYGPIVLAGKMGTKGMKEPAPYSNPNLHNDYYTYDYHVPSEMTHELKMNKKYIDRYIEPGLEPLSFNIKNENITLAPIYNIHRERYVIYWDLINKE